MSSEISQPVDERSADLKAYPSRAVTLTSAIDGELLADVSPEQSRKVLWKIDLFLMPLLGLCYMLQFLDKLSLNYSSILGLLKDVELTGKEYSGRHRSSTSVILSGHIPHRTWSFAIQWGSISLSQCRSSLRTCALFMQC